MSQLKPGDLAWLPSRTALLSFDKSGKDVQEWCYPHTPNYVLIIGEPNEVYFEILYRGDRWSVPKDKLYE